MSFRIKNDKFTVHINITCYYAGWRREPASKIWSNFVFIVVTNWQVFLSLPASQACREKLCDFIGCNFKSRASQVGLNTNRQKILLNFSNGNIFSVRNSGINNYLFEITSMICVFSSNLSLRSCSVVLYTCSASANSAARSFSFSWTWRCSFKTVSLCCSSISWICCNSEAFSCSN